MRHISTILTIGLVFTLSALSAQTLPTNSEDALLRALDDERKAEATYQAVIAELGDVRPFSNIVLAEARHQEHLIALFEKYGIEVPENPWSPDAFTIPATRTEACSMAIGAEVDNVGLYDELFESVEEQDIRDVFTLLSNASETKHMPAFERCASGGGRGAGRGHGRGQGGHNRAGMDKGIG